MRQTVSYTFSAITTVVGTVLLGTMINGHSILSKINANGPSKIAVYALTSAITAYSLFGLLKNASEEFFGFEMPRICDYLQNCVKKDIISASVQVPSSGFEPSRFSAYELCSKALNSSRSDWATENAARWFVDNAKSGGEQIDSCRLKIGLPTLQEERQTTETQKIKRSSNLQICQAAIDPSRREFATTGDKQSAVLEALQRGLSPDNCAGMLGLTPSPTPVRAEIVAATTGQSATSLTNESTGRNPGLIQSRGQPGLPVSTIYNDAVKYAHLRREADGSSEILARLPNGIEVVILGERLSDRGQSWCRVRTSNGSTGYVFSKFVTSPCRLTEQQYQAFNDLEQKRSEENARAFGSILGAVLQNLPKK